MPDQINGTPRPVMHTADGVSLRDYVDRLFTEAQRAIDKAEATMLARLAGMNEFRDQLKDQAGKFITREELDARITSLCNDIKALQRDADVARGKASQNALLFTAAIAIAGFVLGIVRLFMK